MEVINENSALLSNTEVLSLLESIKAELKESKYGQVNEMKDQLNEKEKGVLRFNTIVYETYKYLEEQPCATQTPESVRNFMMAIAPYQLQKAEKLQILNLRPKSLVEIQLLIEESEERFDEDQMNELLEVISSTLPPEPDSDSKPPSEVDEEES